MRSAAVFRAGPRPTRRAAARENRRWLGLYLRALRRCGLSPVAGLLLIMASVGHAAPATIDISKEHRLEAVLLFNLARFVDWPPDAFNTTNAPLVIGILGRDPFGTALDEVVHGETANGHPLRVQRCANLEEAAHCQIVFLSASERTRAREVVSALKGRPVLTVSDVDAFCRIAGGMVGFYVNDQHRMRVRLNLGAAKSAGLSISSKLIQVAELEPANSSMNIAPLMIVQVMPAGPGRSHKAGAGLEPRCYFDAVSPPPVPILWL